MTANRKSTLQSEPVAFRAIGYCRLSKEHGALGVSDSIANQRKLIRAYVEKQPDMELVGEFFDDGYTGTNYDLRYSQGPVPAGQGVCGDGEVS